MWGSSNLYFVIVLLEHYESTRIIGPCSSMIGLCQFILNKSMYMKCIDRWACKWMYYVYFYHRSCQVLQHFLENDYTLVKATTTTTTTTTYAMLTETLGVGGGGGAVILMIHTQSILLVSIVHCVICQLSDCSPGGCISVRSFCSQGKFGFLNQHSPTCTHLCGSWHWVCRYMDLTLNALCRGMGE